MIYIFLLFILLVLILVSNYLCNRISHLENKIDNLVEKASDTYLKNSSDNSVDSTILIEKHYYPTMYSSTDQIKRRNREVTLQNKSKDFRGYAEWTDIEDEALQSEWIQEELSVEEIALLHKRSVGAILRRLQYLDIEKVRC